MSHYRMRRLTLVIAGFLSGCHPAVPVSSSPPERGTAPAAIDTLADEERVYLHTEVDRPAMAIPGPVFPSYPTDLRNQGVQGRVQVRFVVNATGGVERSTIRVISSTHQDFTDAVLKVLPQLRYTPALLGGRRVRMWAIQEFEFRLGVL